MNDLSVKVDEILAKIAYAVTAGRDEIEIPTLKELEGAMKQRIHNKGQDSKGERIGINSKLKGLYTKGYERKKRDGGVFNGRSYAGSGDTHIYPINLQLHGDLMKEFTVGVKNGLNVLEFQTDLARKKVERHEKSYNTVIYKPSDEELEDAKEIMRIGVRTVLRKYVTS